MTFDKMHVSIVIPLYNEQYLIIQLLDKLREVTFPAFVDSWEILIVDDASSDNSYNEVLRYSESCKSVKLFRHTYNQGKGAAVKTGVARSAGNVILIQDADLELTPLDIPALLTAMYELKVPFINGSRYLPGVLRTQAAFKRYFANKLFTLITSIFIDVHLTDMACGFKVITKELFEKLHLRENRFGFEAELLIKCGRLGKNWIAEVPVRYTPRNAGEGKKLRNMDGFRIFKTIVKYGLLRLN